MPETHCRLFSGYKPCVHKGPCDAQCPHRDIVQAEVLIVHLGALGAVLRSTSLLPHIKRKYPRCRIRWVTQKPAQTLLQNNPYIDEVYTLDTPDLLALSTLRFDVAFCVDKSATAYGVIRQTRVDSLMGYRVDEETGAIVPANDEAHELWSLGLDDSKKFYENQKAETQLMVEAFGLGPFQRSEYQLFLTEGEKAAAESRRKKWGGSGRPNVGINTGCSHVIPYKRLSVSGHRELIQRIHKEFAVNVILLGGPEDSARNEAIAKNLSFVHSSPTESGIRDGLCSVEACDLVVSGDSLGMHMAVALKKWVVAWFGPTCSQEIDLYNRGVKVQAEVGCSPCWKRSCDRQPMCYDRVDFQKILQGIEEGIQWLTSSYKQHSSETSSSVSL